MTRSLIVDPTNVRAKGVITAPEIPVNAYEPNFKAELKRHGKQGLIDILHDMIAVRSFETMLNSIKTTGAWNGVEYNHRGPAHLSIGQESAVVGQASQLGADDFVFGSHRSHGEILAKCFSASRKLDAADLERIMKEFLDGETLSFAEQVSDDGLADVAENFILYGAVAETFARKAGFNLISDIKDEKAQGLQQKLGEINKKYKLDYEKPTVEQIQNWIDIANA